MKHTWQKWCVSSLLVALLAACGGGGNDSISVPRPEAFVRITLYDSVYSSLDSLPVRFDVNAATVSTVSHRSPRDIWADVAYPAYRGVLHVTFTRVTDDSSRMKTVDNRTERMALNLGANRAEQIVLDSPGGFSTSILLSRSGGLMPVQFLSVGKEWVVSGAFTFNTPSEKADSIQPVVQALKSDIIHLSQTIAPRP